MFIVLPASIASIIHSAGTSRRLRRLCGWYRLHTDEGQGCAGVRGRQTTHMIEVPQSSRRMGTTDDWEAVNVSVIKCWVVKQYVTYLNPIILQHFISLLLSSFLFSPRLSPPIPSSSFSLAPGKLASVKWLYYTVDRRMSDVR